MELTGDASKAYWVNQIRAASGSVASALEAEWGLGKLGAVIYFSCIHHHFQHKVFAKNRSINLKIKATSRRSLRSKYLDSQNMVCCKYLQSGTIFK
ncbi:MAG: hypothetical protein ACXU7H_01360 [Burkholderiaceae bacterium]